MTCEYFEICGTQAFCDKGGNTCKTNCCGNEDKCEHKHTMIFHTTKPVVKENKNDSVSHPSHYTYGKIECIDFIMDKKLDFPLGNAIKYIVRAGHKHSDNDDMTDKEKTIEDLKKAKQYLEFEIQMLEATNFGLY